jgi:basic membrane lipoprotein Med (substrate-binding protein (PBP1-ABC) superfamily)
MNKTAIAVVLLLVIGGGLGFHFYKKHQEKAARTHKKKPETGAFKVALVTPGAQDDGGWNENAKKALDRIKTELNAETFTRVAVDATQAYASFRNFAGDKKVDVIIAHAGEWNDAKTAQIAAEYPHTVFLISGSEKSDKNVCGVRFVLEDASYVLGQLAASMSKSGVLGCVGPENLPVIESTFYAFEEGAKSVRPDIKVRVLWTGNSNDIVRAKEQTLQLINDGADFIFHNANNGAKGVFEAVQEKKDKGVYAFGSNDDQALTLPKYDEVILASAALDVPGTYVNLCKKIHEGKFEKKTQFVGIADGAIAVAFNKKLANKIPADVQKKIDETIEKLKKGELKAPRRELK